MEIQDDDILLLNQEGINYKITAERYKEIINDPNKIEGLMLVNRSGVDYKKHHNDVLDDCQETDLILINRGGVDYQTTVAVLDEYMGPKEYEVITLSEPIATPNPVVIGSYITGTLAQYTLREKDGEIPDPVYEWRWTYKDKGGNFGAQNWKEYDGIPYRETFKASDPYVEWVLECRYTYNNETVAVQSDPVNKEIKYDVILITDPLLDLNECTTGDVITGYTASYELREKADVAPPVYEYTWRREKEDGNFDDWQVYDGSVIETTMVTEDQSGIPDGQKLVCYRLLTRYTYDGQRHTDYSNPAEYKEEYIVVVTEPIAGPPTAVAGSTLIGNCAHFELQRRAGEDPVYEYCWRKVRNNGEAVEDWKTYDGTDISIYCVVDNQKDLPQEEKYSYYQLACRYSYKSQSGESVSAQMPYEEVKEYHVVMVKEPSLNLEVINVGDTIIGELAHYELVEKAGDDPVYEYTWRRSKPDGSSYDLPWERYDGQSNYRTYGSQDAYMDYRMVCRYTYKGVTEEVETAKCRLTTAFYVAIVTPPVTDVTTVNYGAPITGTLTEYELLGDLSAVNEVKFEWRWTRLPEIENDPLAVWTVYDGTAQDVQHIADVGSYEWRLETKYTADLEQDTWIDTEYSEPVRSSTCCWIKEDAYNTGDIIEGNVCTFYATEFTGQPDITATYSIQHKYNSVYPSPTDPIEYDCSAPFRVDVQTFELWEQVQITCKATSGSCGTTLTQKDDLMVKRRSRKRTRK